MLGHQSLHYETLLRYIPEERNVVETSHSYHFVALDGQMMAVIIYDDERSCEFNRGHSLKTF